MDYGFQVLDFRFSDSETCIPDPLNFILVSNGPGIRIPEAKFPGFWIPQAKISRFPKFRFPLMGRNDNQLMMVCL